MKTRQFDMYTGRVELWREYGFYPMYVGFLTLGDFFRYSLRDRRTDSWQTTFFVELFAIFVMFAPGALDKFHRPYMSLCTCVLANFWPLYISSKRRNRTVSMKAPARTNYLEIAMALRARICLATDTEELFLHETKLASEFGVSRTPIRQVLQRLAYERMVETRSGVGTVTIPLQKGHAVQDSAVYSAVMTAGAACAKGPVPEETVLLVRGLGGLLQNEDLPSAERFFELRSKLLALAAPLFSDSILYDAHLAAHWRIIRWRLREYGANPERTFLIFKNTIGGLERLIDENGTVSGILSWGSESAMEPS